jgi:tripartite-type tricarboxylate transporter receptor subunit TctC
MRRRTLLGLATLALARPALAFPDRPVRVIVPFGPGGFSDVLARFVAEALAPRLGQAVVVENRPGAGGNIAAEALVRAPADGHTLLLAGQAITSINPALYARLPFDPVNDFAAVAMLAEVPNMLLAGPGAPGRTLAEFVAAAKARPGALSYGSVGVGSLTHLAAAMLCAAAGIEMEHVPYRSAGAAQSDLAAGRIALTFESAGTALGLVRGGGGLRALGIAGPRRLADLPEIPAITELLPGYEAVGWFGLLAAATTPAPALARLREETAAVAASAPFQAFLKARAAEPMAVAPQQAAAFLEGDRRRWGEAVRISGAKAE